MKKLTFKVNSEKNSSVVSLIKEVNKISCRIYIDLENGFLTVEKVSNTMIDTVIQLVDNYYTILAVDIDNTPQSPSEEEIIPMPKETSIEPAEGNDEESEEETSEKAVTENIEESSTEDNEELATDTTETVAKKQPTVSEPQTEDDLAIQQLEFDNLFVRNMANRLLRTCFWAMYKMSVPQNEIANFYYSTISEISMCYSKNENIDFSLGDIVECNFGSHLYGEINGTHVHCIVCDVLNSDMAYVVPITKATGPAITSRSYIEFSSPEDAIYKNSFYKGGTALLDKAKYVRIERFISVIGKTNYTFFEKLLHQLASTFDFTSSLAEIAKKTEESNGEKNESETEATSNKTDETSALIENSTAEAGETSLTGENITGDVIECSNVEEDSDNSADEQNVTSSLSNDSSSRKIGREEAALLEVIGKALDKLDKSKSVEEQVEDFMLEINMPIDSEAGNLVAESFVIACEIKKINYENVILELHNIFSNIKEDAIKSSLKDYFKSWLEKYPELAEKCPKISLMSVLKVFARRFA